MVSTLRYLSFFITKLHIIKLLSCHEVDHKLHISTIIFSIIYAVGTYSHHKIFPNACEKCVCVEGDQFETFKF